MFDFKVEFSKAITQAVASSGRSLYTTQAVAELAATLVPADVAKAYGPNMLKSLTRTVQNLRICVAWSTTKYRHVIQAYPTGYAVALLDTAQNAIDNTFEIRKSMHTLAAEIFATTL